MKILNRVPKGPKDFSVLFGAQMLSYFVFSVNARALAQGRVAWTFFTDLFYGFIAYIIIRKVANNESHWGRVGYVLGGAGGSVVAIILTKKLFGQ